MADNNPRNRQSPLFRRLTRLFSGPIVTYRTGQVKKNRAPNYEKYTFTSECSQQYGQGQTNTSSRAVIKDGRLQIRNFTVTFDNTGFFKSSVTPKGRSESIDTFTGAIVASATVNGVNLEDGDFTFAVQSRNDQLVVKLINDSYLPSNFVSAEWQAYYNTTS